MRRPFQFKPIFSVFRRSRQNGVLKQPAIWYTFSIQFGITNVEFVGEADPFQIGGHMK